MKNRLENRKAISLVLLIIIVVIMLILATTVIVFVFRKSPIQNAKDVNLKNDMQTMLDMQNEKYKDLLFQKAGDDSKINDSDFQGIISDEYKDQGFDATKDGVIYRGDDEHVKEIAEEMGIIVTDKNIEPEIEGILYSSTTCTIKVEVTPQDTLSQIDEYNYFLSQDGVNWSKYAEAETPYVIGRLKDNTDFKVKVELVDVNENRVESLPVTVRTKELIIGTLEAKLGSSTGPDYEIGTWTNESVWVNAVPSSTGSTSYSVTGVNKVELGTTTPTTLNKQGVSNLTLITTDGTNNKIAEYSIKIDKDAPTGNLVTDINTNSIAVNIADAADNLSGIKSFDYYLDGDLKSTSTLPNYTFNNLIQGSMHEVKVVVTDVANNSVTFTRTETLPMIPDANAVITHTLNPDTWTNQDVTLKVTYPAYKGLFAQYSDSVDSSGNKIWSSVSEIGQAIDYTTAIRTNKTVYVRYIDITNQVGPEKQIPIVIIDKLAPNSIAISPSTQLNVKSVSVNISAQDANATSDYGMSGIEEVKYLWSTSSSRLGTNDSAWNNAAVVSNNSYVTRSGTSETIYLHVRVKDLAGNYTTAVSGKYIIDNTAPAVSFSPNGNSSYSRSQSSRVTVNDNYSINSDMVRYLWTQSTSAPAESSFPSGNRFTSGQTITKSDSSGNNWYLWVLAKDLAGNTTITRSNVFYLDNTAPVISSFGRTSNGVNNVTFTANASDAHSGIRTYQFYLNNSLKSTVTTSSTSASYNYTGLTPLVNYNFKVIVTDNVGNTAQSSTNYAISNVAEVRNVSVTGYDVYIYTNSGSTNVRVPTWTDRNGQDDLKTPWSSYYLASNLGNGTFRYRVNISEHNYESGLYRSDVYINGGHIASLTATVPADTSAPARPSVTLRYNNSSGSIYPSGTWTSSNVFNSVTSSDNVGVSRYQYSNNGSSWYEIPSGWSPSKSGNNLTYLISSGNQTYYIRAVDYAGNVSPASNAFTIRIDKTPPVAFSCSSPSHDKTSITISASSSDPETGISKYVYEIVGGSKAESTSTSYKFSGLNPGTTYKIRVTAYNGVGLTRVSSNTISVTTDPNACVTHEFGTSRGSDSAEYLNYRIRPYHFTDDWECSAGHWHWASTDTNGYYAQCIHCGRLIFRDLEYETGETWYLWCPY